MEIARPPMAQQIAFLQKVPLLAGFDEKMLELLVGIMTFRAFDGAEILCKEGDPGDACFIIASGRVVVVSGAAAQETVLCTLGPGHTVGEVALIDGKRRSATVRSAGIGAVFVVGRVDFERLCHAGSKVGMRLLDNIAKSLAARVRVVSQRYTEIFSRPGETITKLGESLKNLHATVEGADEPGGDADLLKLVGYKASPSAR